jgi:DNA-binding NtrC family response regulator
MKRRILVVDDDQQMVRTFCDILSSHGWDANGAFSGEEALAAVEEAAFQVVLMDIRMSGMSGVETLVAVKKLRPETRVILMTAYSTAALLDNAEREGALAIISKPVQLPRLMETLEAALGARGPILVVDGDPAFLSSLSAALKTQGYDTLEAHSLDEAVVQLQNSAPRVVLLDLPLDHVEPRDSILTIRWITPAVTIILYSGYPALLRETVKNLPPPWIHATLAKPFPPEQLIALLEEILAT